MRRRRRRGKTTSRRTSATASSRPRSPSTGDGRLAGEERALALDAPRAVLVLADHPGADREERFADEVGVVGRHEADQLEPVDGARLEGLRTLQAERLRHQVGEPAARLVEVGVRDDHGAALARGTQGHARARLLVGQPRQRLEDQRVMGEDQATVEPGGLVQRRVVGLQRDEHALHFVVGRAHLQADVIPRLGQLEGRQTVDPFDDVAHAHLGLLARRVRLNLAPAPRPARPAAPDSSAASAFDAGHTERCDRRPGTAAGHTRV